jgi:hypothetical protein
MKKKKNEKCKKNKKKTINYWINKFKLKIFLKKEIKNQLGQINLLIEKLKTRIKNNSNRKNNKMIKTLNSFIRKKI